MQKAILKPILTVALTTALVACGGSGSGGGSSVSYPSVTDYSLLPMSDSNAETVYASTTQSVTGDATSTPSLPSDALTYTPSTALNSLPDIADLYTTFAVSARAAGGQFDNAQCQGGGTLSATSSDTFSNAGDYINVTFSNCVSGNTRLNGGFRMTLLSSDSSLANLRIDFIQYTAQSGAQTISVNGDMSLRASTIGSTQYVSVQSTQINVQDSESGDTVMTNLLISGELDSSGESRLDIGYNIGSDAINGRVTVSTPMTMVTASGDAWPNIGQMRIDGDGGSYVTLDANTGDINTVLVTINNGSSVQSNTVAWSSLDGAGFGEFVSFQ